MADANTDPSNMTDEELEKAINPTPVEPDEQNPELEPENPEETPEEPEEPVVPEGEEEEPEEEPKPSRREQLRINKLLEKYGDPESPKPRKVENALDYEKELDADPETIKRLQEDRENYSKDLYQQGLEQTKSIQFHTRLEIDAPRVEAKYPQLDKNSDEFNPVLAETVNKMYLSTAGYDLESGKVQNANIRYADYVESLFELADEMGMKKVAESRKNITKQAGSTGLRPDGSAPKRLNLNKAPQDMTDEELNAVINQAIPSRK